MDSCDDRFPKLDSDGFCTGVSKLHLAVTVGQGRTDFGKAEHGHLADLLTCLFRSHSGFDVEEEIAPQPTTYSIRGHVMYGASLFYYKPSMYGTSEHFHRKMARFSDTIGHVVAYMLSQTPSDHCHTNKTTQEPFDEHMLISDGEEKNLKSYFSRNDQINPDFHKPQFCMGWTRNNAITTHSQAKREWTITCFRDPRPCADRQAAVKAMQDDPCVTAYTNRISNHSSCERLDDVCQDRGEKSSAPPMLMQTGISMISALCLVSSPVCSYLF